MLLWKRTLRTVNIFQALLTKNFCVFFGVRLHFSNSLFSLILTLFCISLTSFQMFFVFFLLKHFAVTIQVIDGEADKIFFRR